MMYVVIGNLLVFLLSAMDTTGLFKTMLVFSPRKLPQGEILKTYIKDAEVIYIPYMAKKMPKLKKYLNNASRI